MFKGWLDLRDLGALGGETAGDSLLRASRHVHTMLRKALQDALERGHVVRNVADLANPPPNVRLAHTWR